MYKESIKSPPGGQAVARRFPSWSRPTARSGSRSRSSTGSTSVRRPSTGSSQVIPESAPRVERICRRLDSELGPRGRRLMYTHMLVQRKLMLTFNNCGVPAWEDRLMRMGWPVIVRFANRELGIEPGIEVEDEAAVWREFDFVGELLSDGREHLCGDRFGAADLTFAAMSASMIVPPVYSVPLPQPDILPAHIAAVVERARDHPAGRYALALFTNRRREIVAQLPPIPS